MVWTFEKDETCQIYKNENGVEFWEHEENEEAEEAVDGRSKKNQNRKDFTEEDAENRFMADQIFLGWKRPTLLKKILNTIIIIIIIIIITIIIKQYTMSDTYIFKYDNFNACVFKELVSKNACTL